MIFYPNEEKIQQTSFKTGPHSRTTLEVDASVPQSHRIWMWLNVLSTTAQVSEDAAVAMAIKSNQAS